MGIFTKYAATAAAAATGPTASPATGPTGQSIRGKISGPIPLSNSLDDEFPIRNPGAGAPGNPETPETPGNPGTPIPAASSLSDLPVAAQPSQSAAHFDQSAHASSEVGRSSGRTESTASPSRRVTGPVADSSNRNTYRHSALSAASRGTAYGRDTPQRKKSTLRTALGKLFGRRKAAAASRSSNDTETPSPVGASSQHRSDPSALKRPSVIAEDEPKRSNSLPITEFDRALRSHSIGPDDITVIESVRNSLQADLSFSRRRAATASSRIPVYPRRHETTELIGLSPRPATAQGRASRGPHPEENQDPGEIGMAITSDGQHTARQHRRRSRSLSGLRDLGDGRGELRRRSDEIRYWRQSYDPGFTSPLSSDAPEGEGEGEGEGDDIGIASLDLPASSGSQEQQQQQQQPRTPPQPFDFGAIAASNEMAGMRITEAASLATQMGGLEMRVSKLEQLLVRVLHQRRRDAAGPERRDSPAAAAQQQQKPRHKPSQEFKPSSGRTPGNTPGSPNSPSWSSPIRLSFDDAPAHLRSLHAGLAHVTAPHSRPNTTTTVHGVASLPTLSMANDLNSHMSVSADQYNTLLTLLRTERSERHELASQVRGLERRFAGLAGPAPIRHDYHHASYDPSAASAVNDIAVRSTGEPDVADDGDSSNEGRGLRSRRRFAADDLAVTTHGADGDEGEDDDDDDDDDDDNEAGDFPEVFSTPREEQPAFHVFGAFGEELRETKGDGGRKAARTLSLSQLTAGHVASPEQA